MGLRQDRRFGVEDPLAAQRIPCRTRGAPNAPDPSDDGEPKRPFGPETSDRENFAIAFNPERFASSRGHTLLELALGWLLAKPQVATVIAAASSPEQVRSNVAAA